MSANHWYPDAWAELAGALVRERDARVVLSGGPQDRASAAEVQRLSEVDLEDRVGTLTLKQSAGLFEVADLFIGGDTGPLHMAVAVGDRRDGARARHASLAPEEAVRRR